MKKNFISRLIIFFPLIFFVLLVCVAVPPRLDETAESKSPWQTEAQFIGLPAFSPGDQIITHAAYTLKYNEKCEQAEWVAYKLVYAELKDLKRAGKFRVDPAVKTGSAAPEDYSKSGYDKGHLAPAADMKYSVLIISESFFMSNISPQKPEFNRGIWKCLEEHVRAWAEQNKELYIVTAGILKGDLSVIGKKNRVGVPLFFYKVILDYKEPELKAIAFIVPNEGSDENLQSFAVTIDQVEEATGIDFFPALPDNIEEILESAIDLSKWEFKKCQ